MSNMEIFNRLESEVRSYGRTFPTVFARSKGAVMYDTTGREYIDFFAGAGTLNYGHNNDRLKQVIIDYLQNDGITHSLDMGTVAKQQFLETFEQLILKPRGLDYKVQFTGPTGANAVEAALKIARKVKQRHNIIAFSNAYHGLSLGALALTSNSYFRNPAFSNSSNVTFMPFDGFLGEGVDTLPYIRAFLESDSSGVDKPAAVILETIQAEGGINVATINWLKGLAQLCQEQDILLIVDDIQTGNGRTGHFFSFEQYGIQPDIVTLSKAIGGFGLPMSLVLLKPNLDIWKKAEHTGTFRGNNLAFVAAREAFLAYWQDEQFAQAVQKKEALVTETLTEFAQEYAGLGLQVRGRGLMNGLKFADPKIAAVVAKEAFQQGLIIELCGPKDEVLKCLPPLVIEEKELTAGLEIIRRSIHKAVR